MLQTKIEVEVDMSFIFNYKIINKIGKIGKTVTIELYHYHLYLKSVHLN